MSKKRSTLKKVEVRPLTMDAFDDFASAMNAAYPDWSGGLWKRETIARLLGLFPEGQLGVFVNGKLAGCALTIIVDVDKLGLDHTYMKATGGYTFNTHDRKGNVLYGIEVFVHPEYRGKRLGRRLYEARKELCEHLNLRSVMFGGRIPNYHKHAKKLTPKQYITKVREKVIHDPVLSFQLSNDFHVVRLLKGYMPDDVNSMEYATLMEWDNIYHNEADMSGSWSRNVRLGLVQWKMRNYAGIDGLFEHLDFFLQVVSGYGSDFAVFPELFNAPLMAMYDDQNEAEAIRSLAEHTIPIRDYMVKAAMKYNVNIVTGSMPMVEGGILYNMGFLCRRDGSWERYEKVHVTPNEKSAWGIHGGRQVRVFDTDCGKVGVVICYDCEFPELVRLLALQGMQLLFIPFLTDTQNAFSRVRLCAMARAIENECFVAIAGSVGNLPKVKNMDIQYAQSAVFTPCDFAFPASGIKGEATANTEMVLVVDVDLSLLKDLHHRGSVQNLKDRREDIYTLRLSDQ
ncbi:MAG: bifunctional GNAT family N-acetyltransferase/carbon-nitrogen hydrolase family protein [Flavobacteriales bacterium]|jgi:predicted amidohydrolase/GNAT superfamily N-acetyltransferase|nr:bifunctional GNAT family N-acetyltransferase/carbon-nitrogen hydrolase family protein [Flavobacteriales bacterium]MCB0757462.1 bifunctional GNAT family N-acetyltransferase/carbon-nitrogen hydrolase family protein [Flavobacteriales bacterium]